MSNQPPPPPPPETIESDGCKLVAAGSTESKTLRVTVIDYGGGVAIELDAEGALKAAAALTAWAAWAVAAKEG